jgi:hypothetical protein
MNQLNKIIYEIRTTSMLFGAIKEIKVTWSEW